MSTNLLRHADIVRKCAEGDPETICRVVGHDHHDAAPIKIEDRIDVAPNETFSAGWYTYCVRCGKDRRWLRSAI